MSIMNRLAVCVCSAAAVMVFVAGCGSSSSTPSAPPTTPPPSTNSAIKVTDIDIEGFKKYIASQQGKVVLVDFWATWCGPCKIAFPHTIELSHKYADRGLATATISLDDLEARKEVIAFLQEKNATTDNFLSVIGGGGATADPVDAFEITDGAIPHFKLYDRKGKMRKSYVGIPEEPEFTQMIETLLAEAP